MKHLLLVPSKDDPDRLIEPTFPFARVPTVFRASDWVPSAEEGGWRPGAPSGWRIGDVPEPEYSVALVLVWNGEVVPEGVDRAIRMLNKKDIFSSSLHYKYDMLDAIRVAVSKHLRCTVLEIE